MERESKIEIGCPICSGTGCQTCLSPEEFSERMAKEIEKKNNKDKDEDETDDEDESTEKSVKEVVKIDKIEDDGLSFECEICQDKGCPECGGGA